MARKIRIEFAGAAYHVMARGNQGREIYQDDRDRKLWLDTLGEACGKTGWRLHARVMMNNHYHLLWETPEALLAAGMKWLPGACTQRYHSRHEMFGHLLAWWLWQHTTARRRWVSERLWMGDESRVTQAIGRVKRDGQPEQARLKRRLEQVYEGDSGRLEA